MKNSRVEALMDRAQTSCFDLNLKFPDDYKVNTELAGKDVTFEVTLNGVYK